MAQTFFTIEVFYKHEAIEGREVYRNFTAAKLKQFRELVFDIGIMVPVDTETWYIVSPIHITSITVYRQQKFFTDGNDKNKR